MPVLAVPTVLAVEDDPILDGYDQSIPEARAESRRAIGDILSLLGYPEEWATEIERRTFERGRIWHTSA